MIVEVTEWNNHVSCVAFLSCAKLIFFLFALIKYFHPSSGIIVQLWICFSMRFCQDIGGCDIQKQEIREAVELPLTHHELYQQIGIDPPRGVLLYGPPGTGKTMLAKAVAHHTTASFIRVVGSEFVQKYLGEVCFNDLILMH